MHSISKQERSLRYLYQSTIGRIVRPLLTNRFTAKIIGWYADSRVSRVHIKSFVKQYHIDLEETEQKDIKKYRSFNDFFARKLDTQARIIDNHPHTIISPCDGQLYVIERVTRSTTFLVKEVPLTLEQLLQDKALADYFYDGVMMIFYLAPWNYHRFHFPLDCIPDVPRKIAGIYESVNPAVYAAGIQPLLKNERQLWLLHTATDDLICFIPVGALCVGRICQNFIPHQCYAKGLEAGYFSFGGSSIVLLFRQGFCQIDDSILQKTKSNNNTDIYMGQRIATKVT